MVTPYGSLVMKEAKRLNGVLAGWQSGYAAACKAVDAGSIPTPALFQSYFLKTGRKENRPS